MSPEEIEKQKVQKPKKDPNEIREVSMLKRNLRLLKRILLGKKQPSMFLKILCFIFLAWDFLMVIGFIFIGFANKLGDYMGGGGQKISPELLIKYFFTYSILHFVSFFAVLGMWRKNVIGFYMFVIVNLLMPFWYFFITGIWEFQIWVLGFSLVSIALFAVNWKAFNLKKKEKLAIKEAKKSKEDKDASPENQTIQ